MCERKLIWQRSHELLGREVQRCQQRPYYWIGLTLVLISSALMVQGINWLSNSAVHKSILLLTAFTAGFLTDIGVRISVRKELFLIMRGDRPDILLNGLNLCGQASIWGAIMGYAWYLVAMSLAAPPYWTYFAAYVIGWLASGVADTIRTIRLWYGSRGGGRLVNNT